ncbi:MAG: hypothetical protein U9Q98_08870 [Bacteroidota bacterium]|nr:hypothetical protein [Bacteroidota bacterium]
MNLPLPFIGRFSIQDNPEAVAKDILKGGPNYYLLQLNRNSRLFTQTVLDEYRGGNIEPTDASNLLNIKVNKFPKLEAQMYR